MGGSLSVQVGRSTKVQTLAIKHDKTAHNNYSSNTRECKVEYILLIIVFARNVIAPQ